MAVGDREFAEIAPCIALHTTLRSLSVAANPLGFASVTAITGVLFGRECVVATITGVLFGREWVVATITCVLFGRECVVAIMQRIGLYSWTSSPCGLVKTNGARLKCEEPRARCALVVETGAFVGMLYSTCSPRLSFFTHIMRCRNGPPLTPRAGTPGYDGDGCIHGVCSRMIACMHRARCACLPCVIPAFGLCCAQGARSCAHGAAEQCCNGHERQISACWSSF